MTVSSLRSRSLLTGAAFVGLFLLTLLHPAFGRNDTTNSKGQTVLRVSGLPNPSDLSATGIARLRAMDRFLALNPDIELVNAEGLRVEGVNHEVSTIMMIAGDIAPDVLGMNFRSIDTFVSRGLVMSLDEWVKKAEEAGVDITKRIPKQVADVVYRPSPEDDVRRLYGLPEQLLVRGLYYNKELFTAVGLPPRVPKTWDEMIEFCRKIVAHDSSYKGLHLAAGRDASWDLINFIWSAGGESVIEVAPNEWRAAFDSDAAVLAIEFYYRLLEIERVAIRAGNPTAQEREKYGMFFGYVGDNASFDPERFGFGAVPLGPTGVRGSEVNSRVLGVFSQIKDPKVIDAAWRYIVFMTGEEAEKIRIDTQVEMGQANQVNPVYLRRYGYEQFLALTPPGFEQEFEETLANAKPEPYGRNCNLVYQEMTYPLDQVLLDPSILQKAQADDWAGVRKEIKSILEKAVVRTNERMIGYVPPETMKFRRMVASGVVVAIFACFIFVGWYIGRIFSHSASLLSRPVNSRSLIPWFCLFPAAALVLVWSYVPLVRGTVMAFQDYELVLDSAYVGLDNFATALFDPTFWNAILATFHFAFYTLTFGFAAPILLAYALHLIPKYKILYRTVYYLPAVMSGTAIFFLWRELFGLDGPLNETLRFFGMEARRPWTDEPMFAMLTCVIPGIWASAGPGCLIYLAALKTIPEEQFEASEIDGAGFIQKTTRIVYPGLRALIFINFIGAVAASFHGATNILIMTGGGPNGMTEVISLKIFFEAFARLRFGPATAMAWVLGSMLIGFTVIQLKRLSQMEFKTAR